MESQRNEPQDRRPHGDENRPQTNDAGVQERILERLAGLDRRLDARLADPDNPESIGLRLETEVRNRLRDDALRVRHQLIIQREALGLARQAPVEQCYPVPDRRRLPALPADGGGEP